MEVRKMSDIIYTRGLEERMDFNDPFNVRKHKPTEMYFLINIINYLDCKNNLNIKDVSGLWQFIALGFNPNINPHEVPQYDDDGNVTEEYLEDCRMVGELNNFLTEEYLIKQITIYRLQNE